jgi:hypothetical protein
MEELRWWKLPVITNDHRLAAPGNRTEGLSGTHLAGFVENHNIEVDRRRRQEAGDGVGTHHEDRLDDLNGGSGLGN